MGETQVEQLKLPTVDDFFLSQRLEESRTVIRQVAKLAEKPLILQFSGGRDSMAMLGLVCEVTDHFICAYMATGLELKNTIPFVKEVCAHLGVQLLISNPGMHKGNIFHRIAQFQSFPNIGTFNGGGSRLWCCRDLKLRPQKKLLVKTFGKGTFYRLEGIRRWESDRRKIIYRPYAETFMRPDDEFPGSWEVYPILNWSDSDVLNFLEAKGLPTMGLYNQFGVSGCGWCPFYPPEVYAKVLAVYPQQYDRFIEWEGKLNLPSVQGKVFLRDIKRAVLEGLPLPQAEKGRQEDEAPTKSPCMIMWEGRWVPTCSVYGHCFIKGLCFRCGLKEKIV